MSFLRLLRIHHWSKNILLFLPIVMAHATNDLSALGRCLIAFVAFSCVASAGYIFNDLKDIESDRQNSLKKKRPLASGDVSNARAQAVFISLIAIAFALGFFLSHSLALLLSFYLFLSLAYSLRLKTVLILDVVLLASFYTLRILIGGVATNIVVSEWLLSFSLFFFLSLALAKRVAELMESSEATDEATGKSLSRRPYGPNDIETLSSLGIASGMLSVLVLALYVSSAHVQAIYAQPNLIWILCILNLYWVARIWVLVRRSQMHQDPVIFALSDPPSYLTGVLGLLVIWVAA